MHLIAGNDPSNQAREIECDYEGSIIAMDYWHNAVHAGRIWVVNYLNEALENNGQMLLRGTTGSKTLHFIVEFTNGGDGTFKTYAGTTYTTPDSGTLADGINMTVFNRRPQNAIPLETVFRYAPTVNVLGIARGLRAIPGGSGGNSTGSSQESGLESNIPPNTDFLIILTNKSGQTKISDIVIDCYEE